MCMGDVGKRGGGGFLSEFRGVGGSFQKKNAYDLDFYFLAHLARVKTAWRYKQRSQLGHT